MEHIYQGMKSAGLVEASYTTISPFFTFLPLGAFVFKPKAFGGMAV
jgi:hypothetical protein